MKRKTIHQIALSAIPFVACFSLHAGQFAAIGKTSLPPKIDGIADEKCWEYAPPITGLSMPGSLIYASDQTTLKLCYDATNLYGFFRCEQKEMDKLPQGSKIPDDGIMWKGHGVEMFFLAAKPTAENYEAKHFIINPEGTITDAAVTSVNGERTHTSSWNSAITLVAAKNNDHWTGEFQIPWKSLSISPAPDTTFTFNLVRNNPSQNESSSWSRLEKHDWWQVEAFSRIQLAQEVVGFDFMALPSLASKSLNLQLRYSEAMNPIAKVTTGKFTQEGIPNAEKQITFDYSVPTNTAGTNPFVRMKLYDKETCLYDFLYEPLGEHISISPCNGIEEKMSLSPDFDAAITWNCRHNLPGFNNPGGGKVKKNIEIVFDLPAGITLAGGKKVETLTFEGETYNRYIQPQSYVYNAEGWFGSVLKTTLPVGATGKIRYFARWDNSSQPPKTVNFEVINIPKTHPPKQFIAGIYDLRFNNLAASEKYIQLGINTFSVRGFDQSAIQTAKELKQAGLNVQRGPYFWPGGKQDDWQIWTKNDRSARAVDINGFYVNAGNAYQLSPSYRGKYFEEAMAKELDFIRETGITYFSFDMEGRLQEANGAKVCFSDRTIEAFKSYFKEKHPQMPYMDPKVFEKSPETYPEYHSAWVNFKCYIWADLFMEMKKRFAAALNLPLEKIIFTEWSMRGVFTEESRNETMQGKEWLDVFNFYERDSYSSLDRNVRECLSARADEDKLLPDATIKFIVNPCPRRLQDVTYYKTNAPAVKDEFKYKILNYAALGAAGSIIWTNKFVNLDTLRQFAEAINIINKVENIVINGVRIKNISTDQPKCEIADNFRGKGNATWKDQDSVFVCGLELAGQALICVSEYREQKEMVVAVNYQVKQPSEIVDVETDKVIGEMTPSDTSFKVTLPADNRCRLFLLKPRKPNQQPNNNPENPIN